MQSKVITELSLGELLPYTLFSMPIAAIYGTDKVWIATAMLSRFLESFTDGLVVIEENQPVGLIGGKDIISEVFRDPSSDLFDYKTTKEIMASDLCVVSKETKLLDLLKQWERIRRGFGIIKNDRGNYSAISVRTLLEVAAFLNTDIRVRDIPKKKIITYREDDTVKEIIISMLEHQTRRLVLDGTSLYISDRLIIEKIATTLNYLHGIDNFLDLKANIFTPVNAKVVSEELTIPQLCQNMLIMSHPYVISHDQVISPWDIVMILMSMAN